MLFFDLDATRNLESSFIVPLADEGSLRGVLTRLEPIARDRLRRILIADHDERDRIAEALLRQQSDPADNLADLIDLLTLDPDARRRVVRVLGEVEANG